MKHLLEQVRGSVIVVGLPIFVPDCILIILSLQTLLRFTLESTTIESTIEGSICGLTRNSVNNPAVRKIVPSNNNTTTITDFLLQLEVANDLLLILPHVISPILQFFTFIQRINNDT